MLDKQLTGVFLLNKGTSSALLRGSQARVKEGIQIKRSKMPVKLYCKCHMLTDPCNKSDDKVVVRRKLQRKQGDNPKAYPHFSPKRSPHNNHFLF